MLTLEIDADHGLLTGAGPELEGPESDVALDGSVRELAVNEALCIQDSVGGISGVLVLCSVTDEAL